MKNIIRFKAFTVSGFVKVTRTLGAALAVGACLLNMSAVAQTMANYTAVPPLSERSSQDPMIMLTLAADHQLFIKAYNEYDDLNGDGRPDLGYNHDFAYIGYFDNQRCYSYGDGEFVPGSAATIPTGFTVPQYCAGNEWSGNFLNWASMTRADIVRLVLYGGYRSTDEADKTVLERAYLPSDTHSFVKYYDDAKGDINKLIPANALAGKSSCSTEGECNGFTFCNTSQPVGGNVLSQDASVRATPPLLRVVKGNYSFWASGERYQCLTRGDTGELLDNGIGTTGQNVNNDAEQVLGEPIFKTSPAKSAVADYHVRVQACANSKPDGSHKCELYGTNKKPVGILQEVGGQGQIKIGLMTRGYDTNKSHGVLRKNISSFAEEINDDGTFNTEGDSIVESLDALRLVDYRYDYTVHDGWQDTYYRGTYLRQEDGVAFDGGIYNFVSPANYDCTWGLSTFENGMCRNWGNPFSELMTESYRYLAGAAAPSVSGVAETGIPGLSVATWEPPTRRPTPPAPTSEDLSCVNMNVLAFNASAVSYDGDELADRTLTQLGLPGGGETTVADLTENIGQLEGMYEEGKLFFVGETGVSTDQQCTPKAISNLANVRGTCPDAPRLEGSYLVSGLAHYARTNDMLPHVDGTNTISTFGVTLAGTLPTIRIPVGDREITIIPACHNESIGGNCALVDFRPLNIDNPSEGGDFVVTWEDSEQGGDYDQDLNGVISYEVIGNILKVSTRVYTVSSEKTLYFGYVLSGTGNATNDTLHQPSKVEEEEAVGCAGEPNCSTENNWQVKSFSLASIGSTAAAQPLKSPLEYAAKYGGFKDIQRDGNAANRLDPGEWDEENPRAYTAVTNPGELAQRLQEVFQQLVERPSSGSGAAVASNTLTGEGLLLQALYDTEVAVGDDVVNWVGSLNGLFFDAYGNLREDTNGDDTLNNGDKILELVFNQASMETRVNRYPFANGERGALADEDANLPLSAIKPVWSARDQLGELTDAQKRNQRSYTASAGSGRYIFTSIDADNNGVTTKDDMLPFTTTTFSNAARGDDPVEGLGANNPLLLDSDRAADVVNYIRGVEDITGFRSRTVDYGDGRKPWLLGDIAHSTPAVVSRPADGYNTAYSDSTYVDFRNKYANRRQVAYVGANDGLLHAFNMGVYDPATGKYDGSGHPLGAELWAYAPYNLLPHLKWLTDPAYSHVYYVDGNVKAFDVNIFEDDGPTGTYPHGWGTIIVVGMRFGGGEYVLEQIEGEASARTFRSAYMVFDVTDPEQAPKLIAEISHPDLGHTLADAEVVTFRQGKAGGGFNLDEEEALMKNGWHLVLGSGPTDITRGVSGKSAKIFTLDLRQARNQQVELTSHDITAENGFVSGITAVDWNSDFVDDHLYVSVVGDGAVIGEGESENLGSLNFAALNSNGANIVGTVAPLLKEGVGPLRAPFSTPVLPVRQLDTGEYWIYAGTGRFLVSDDITNDYQGAYYGIKISTDSGTTHVASVDIDDMYDVTGHKLYETEVYGATVVIDDEGTDLGTLGEFAAEQIGNKKGWYRTFAKNNESTFIPTSRFRTALFINSYAPAISGCEALGTSYQYALNAFTGLPDANLGNLVRSSTSTVTKEGESHKEVVGLVGQAAGVITGTAIIGDSSASTSSTAAVEGDTNELEGVDALRRSWREVPMDALQ